MERWVKFLSQQNSSGVSGLNSVSAKFNTIQIQSGPFFRLNKTTEKNNTTCLHTARVLSSRCPQAPTFIFEGNTHTHSRPRGTCGVHVPVATSASLAISGGGLLALIQGVNELVNVGACGHFDDTTRAVWRHVVFLLLFNF